MTTFIARGEVYDQPLGCETDLQGLLLFRRQIAEHRSSWPAVSVASLFADAFAAAAGLVPDLPAAGLGGAGFPAPVSLPAPGAPNETRNR